MNPMRPLPAEWVPDDDLVTRLTEEFGSQIDLGLSLRRFRNHYSEGQTSRNWNARFENWCISDAERARPALQGTDDLGIPLGQRRPTTPSATPEEDNIQAALEAARARPPRGARP